jgi:M6 family metalloprotease-like protein
MRKKLSIAVLVSLLSTLLAVPSHAAVKAGSKCAKNGQVKIVQNKQYTCTKSGKRLIWSKGLPVKKTAEQTVEVPKTEELTPAQGSQTQTTTSESKPEPQKDMQTYSEPSVQSSNVEVCKLRENSSTRNGALFALPTGFPSTNSLAVKTGTVKWALIPIDFPDMKGGSEFRSRVDTQMKLVSEWFETVSEGKFKVEWVVASGWVTLPNPTSQYAIKQSMNLGDAANGPKLFKDAMAAADPVFDFTNVQTVNFILPEGQKFVEESSQGFPWDAPVKDLKLNEGKISSFAIPGTFFDQLNRQYWSYWVHEFGHAMGIPHIGSSREPNPFMNLDIMGNQDGFTKELSGWHRFVAGWLDDQRVYCQEYSKLGTTDLTLIPLSNSTAGLKMSVVQVSPTKAVIIESRRETKYACTMPGKKNGVLVYLYDATKGHAENYFVPIGPSGRQNEGSSNCPVVPYPDPLLYAGDSVTVEGVKIEVLESKDMDKIRISK